MAVISSERRLRVLVVDSDRALQRLLVLIFQREGWLVTTAADGDAALELLRTELPDLLVLDLMLPGMSGFDVLKWIEATKISWLQHVIILTAASRKVLENLSRTHGICRLVRKPFDIRDLVANVASCADALGIGGQQHQYAVGGMRH